MEDELMDANMEFEGDGDMMNHLGIVPCNNEEDTKLPQNIVKGEANLEPYEGMEFESEEAARTFYSAYARQAGFRIRISRYTRSRRDNSIISRLIVCSKEGFRESRGGDGCFGERRQQRQRAVTRVGCKAMMMVKKLGPGKWVVSKFIKEHNHGPVPPRKVEVMIVRKEEGVVERLAPSFSPDGDAIQEPVEGMEFDSEEDARSFYINYARKMGFRARISKYCRSRRDNAIISRQIVCSKEGFREVRIKKEMSDEGRVKRPRVITRIGCKAMMIVKKMNSGKWVVSRFEKEHNHALLTSKKVPRLLQSSQSDTEKSSVTCLGGANVVPHANVVISGCCGGLQGTSRESLTVLYNQLCYEAIRYAQEGAVSEEIFNVAMSALKEAVEKVAAAKKRSGITVAQSGVPAAVGQTSSRNIMIETKPLDESKCSTEVKQAVSGQELMLLQQPLKFVLIPSASLPNGPNSNNSAIEAPLILNVPNGQSSLGTSSIDHVSALKQSLPATPSTEGLAGKGPMSSELSAGRKRELQMANGEAEHDGAVKKSQKLEFVRVAQAKPSSGNDNYLSSSGGSEAQMVAVPALPVTLYMPLMGSLAEPCSVTATSATPGSYALIAAPIEPSPLSATSAAETGPQSQATNPQQSTADQSHQSFTGPNPQVHATAIAAGARVVPPQEAASLIKAIEARVRSAKSAALTASNGCKPLATIESCSPRPCNGTQESQQAANNTTREGGSEVQGLASAEEMRLDDRSDDGLKEIELGMDHSSMDYNGSVCEDHLFSGGM